MELVFPVHHTYSYSQGLLLFQNLSAPSYPLGLLEISGVRRMRTHSPKGNEKWDEIDKGMIDGRMVWSVEDGVADA